MAVHAVTPAARLDAGHFRPRRHWGVGCRGWPRARNGYSGLGSKILVGKSRRRGIPTAASKQALYERSDVLSLHVRLTRDTYGVIGPNDLGCMKPTALIVNTARAELIAPGALLEAL